MKQLFPAVLALATALPLQAQTTALDFTASDCDHISHTLFSELDSGYTVVLEFVMMGCQPCITACHSLTDDVLPNVSDPAHVRLYSIGFTNSLSCTQMNDWKAANGFTHTVFAGMSSQVTYYGGFGMPTVVVVGGPDHTVFYAEQGHDDSDNPIILAAIEDGLAAAADIGVRDINAVNAHPNPVSDVITFDAAQWDHARVLDTQGREVRNTALVAGKLDVSALRPGIYLVHLRNAAGAMAFSRFEKQ